MGAVWTPDGDSLVFARAPAADPNPPGVPLAQFANDPAELQIRYDLYRIPFRNGRGGVAEPLAGASANGMSNSFPKVSPDGKWIVYVQSRNGELMRPDSQLYIVPAAGGTARRMRCNTSRMNSWHSFSPNGRWLVFSSKSRGPYTQMYLTHIDAQGNDSPAILVDNTTAANRAVNIPEFVNVPLGGLRQIGGPVLDYYRQYNRAAFLQKRGRYREAAEKWQSVLELGPEDEAAHRALGTALLIIGRREEAGVHFQKANELKLRAAVESEPASGRALNDLGVLLLHSGRAEEAASKLRQAVALEPAFAAAHANLGGALVDLGGLDEAQAHLDRALALDSVSAPAHYYLGLLLSRRGDADGAIREWRSAVAGDPKRAEAHTHLGDALYARGRPAEALAEWHLAVDLQPADPAALVRVAWALATSSDGSIRNGGEALAYAVRAVELPGGKIARVLDAMAAAYAEKGQFANAVLTARRALAQAGQEKQDALAAAIAGRIRLYESEQAYREP